MRNPVRSMSRPLYPVFLLALMLLLAACSTSTRTLYLDAPVPQAAPAAPPAPVDAAAYQATYAGEDGAYLDYNLSYEHVLEKTNFPQTTTTWTIHEIIERRYVVLDTEAEELTTFRIEVGPNQRLENLHLHAVAPDSTVQTFARDDLRREEGSGGKAVYKLAYPAVEPGTVIEERFEVKHMDLFEQPQLSHQIGLQFAIPCEQLRLRYVYPETWEVQVKALGPERELDVHSAVHPSGKSTILTYEAAGIPGVKEEPFAPFFKEVADYLHIAITKMKLRSYATYEAPASWPEVAERFEDYAIGKDPFFSSRVRRTTEEVVEGKATDRAKLDAILGYVYETIDVRMGSEATDFADVLKSGAGNPYLVTGLVQSMLSRAELPAEYLLVHSAQDGYFDTQFVTGEQLYVPALRVHLGDAAYHVFPYLKNLPVDHVPEAFQGQEAMLVTDDGYSGFTTLPRGNAAENAVEENYDLTIGEDGGITVEEEKVLRGSEAYFARQRLADLEADELEEAIKELLTYSDGEVEWVSHELVNRESYDQPLRIQLTYRINNLVTVTPEEVLFQTAGLFAPLSGTKHKVDLRTRQNPIRIHYDQRQRKNIVIRYPRAWTPVTALADVDSENRFGQITGTYAVTSGRIEAQQQIHLNQSAASRADMETLLQLVGSGSELSIPTLIFQRASEGSSDAR